MALDWPAFGDALWRLNDELGIRPEWVLPVLYLESKFDPSSESPSHCVGINQFCRSAYWDYVSVPVEQYRQWPASRQLAGPVFNFWRNAQEGYGPLRSATRLMISQLGHGLLNWTKTLDSTVFAAPSAEYYANCTTAPAPCLLDPTGKGYILVQDVANALSNIVRKPEVQEAIARAYAMRPWGAPSDPIYGGDFGQAPVPPVPAPAPGGGGPEPMTGWQLFGAVTGLAGAAAFGTALLRWFVRKHT